MLLPKLSDEQEWIKFKLETTRTVLLAVFGTLAVGYIIKPWEQSQNYEAELAKTRLSIQAKVVDDFIAASERYTAVAYDACKAYAKEKELRDPKEADSITEFEDKVVDDYRTTIKRIEHYFEGAPSDVREQVEQSRLLHDQLFAQCKAKANKETWNTKRGELKSANGKVAVAALQYLCIIKAGDRCQ